MVKVFMFVLLSALLLPKVVSVGFKKHTKKIKTETLNLFDIISISSPLALSSPSSSSSLPFTSSGSTLSTMLKTGQLTGAQR
jgi:hypothetical protein